MDAQVAVTAPIQATSEFCTFAVHDIRALAPSDDPFGDSYAWHEALIRPRGGWTPGEFIDQLYRDDSVLATDLEVLRRMGQWLLDRDAPTRISINTHPESLSSHRFMRAALDIHHEAERAGHSLCVELIEFGSCREKSALIRNAQTLRRAGVLIALDDFGSRINCFDLCAAGIVDLLKIDINVTCGVHVDRNQRAIVESIKTLGRGLGARVIAEGVETLEQVNALRDIGVEYAQGFHFQKPQMLEI